MPVIRDAMDFFLWLFFVLIFVFVVGSIILGVVGHIRTRIRNDASPRLAREARVIGKRLQVAGGKDGSGTWYYATFEFPD